MKLVALNFFLLHTTKKNFVKLTAHFKAEYVKLFILSLEANFLIGMKY